MWNIAAATAAAEDDNGDGDVHDHVKDTDDDRDYDCYRDVDRIHMWHVYGSYYWMHHTCDYGLGNPSTTCKQKSPLSAHLMKQNYVETDLVNIKVSL